MGTHSGHTTCCDMAPGALLALSSARLHIGVNHAPPSTGLVGKVQVMTGAMACRSSSSVHTRRVLAPSHCLSRTGRRRRPGSGGGPEDDDISDSGSGGADGGGGGNDYNEGPWYEDDDADARGSSGLIWLWQAFSLCVLIQVSLAPDYRN